MKKICLLTLLCFLLTACGRAPAVPDLAGADFTADILFTLDGREYAAVYTREGEREAAEFRRPETLSGLIVHTDGGGEYTCTVGEVSFAAEAARRALAFAKLFSPPAGCLKFAFGTDGAYCFRGSDGENTYTVYTDLSGLVTRLSGRVDGREYDIQILRMERSDRT